MIFSCCLTVLLVGLYDAMQTQQQEKTEEAQIGTDGQAGIGQFIHYSVYSLKYVLVIVHRLPCCILRHHSAVWGNAGTASNACNSVPVLHVTDGAKCCRVSEVHSWLVGRRAHTST